MNRLALLMQALDYYGLPSNYQRIFTKVGKSGFRPISISDAVSRQTYAWVQINDVDPGFPIDKPYNKDIVCVRNISLDIDYAKDPTKAHRIAISFSEYISNLFAHPTIPVEDTGGGSHIVIPIPRIDTALYGGGEAINLAIRRTVDELFKPEFLSLCDAHGVGRKEIDFGSYDVSRILSAPGTFRPPHATNPDAPFLKNGYIRKWLDIYDINDIVRIECRGLRDAILDRVASPA